MNEQILNFSESDENLPPPGLKEYMSIDHLDHVSLKERKAKRNLFELGIEEDNKFSMELVATAPKRAKIVCINPWSNQNHLNLEDTLEFAKYRQDCCTFPLNRLHQSKPFSEKQTNIPYLKDLLLRLESPSRKKSYSSYKKGFYYGPIEQSIKNSYRSARISQAIKVKENWAIKQSQPRSIYEPFSSASCRLNRTESRGTRTRANSQSSKKMLQDMKKNDLVKMILQKKKESLVKKKKVPPAKILNFNAKIPHTKLRSRERFNLFELLH